MSYHPPPERQTDESLDESSAQLISRMADAAQQERQETTQREALRERPSFILDIEQSEVKYTLSLKYVPLEHVDFSVFARQMEDRWGLTFDVRSLKVDPTVLQRLSEQSKLNEEDFESAVVKQALPDHDIAFVFRDGKYPLPQNEFVQISRVELNYESVLVSVGGIGQVAEAVAQEVLEELNAAAGAQRPWSALANEVLLVGYATRTKVDLGSPSAFEGLLSPRLLTFMQDEMTEGRQFGAHAGGYHARHDLRPPPNSHVVVALDDLSLRISSFDDSTGNHRESNMWFSVRSRGEYRSGVISISSELPYDIHEECLGVLIERMHQDRPLSSESVADPAD